MKNKITRETKEILLVIMLDKFKRIAEDAFEKASKEKQRELTRAEKLDLIDDMVFLGTVFVAYLGVSVEELKRCIYMNFQ